MAAALGPSGWWQRWRRRLSARNGSRMLLLLLLVGSGQGPRQVGAGQTFEYLKREHSLSKPYQGVGTGSSSLWNLMGNAMVMTQYIRLTPDMQSKQGALWNRVPCFLRDWELQVHFKIHGQGKKNLHGDGLAIWYTKDRMQPGPVFGNMDKFVGLGVFVDTYPNEEKQQEIMMDIDGKHEWRDCIEVPGVRLPRGYYFGTSSITGDLSDNHDVISLKLFELTVERTPEEEKLHRDVFLPSVDNMKLPEENTTRITPHTFQASIRWFLLFVQASVHLRNFPLEICMETSSLCCLLLPLIAVSRCSLSWKRHPDASLLGVSLSLGPQSDLAESWCASRSLYDFMVARRITGKVTSSVFRHQKQHLPCDLTVWRCFWTLEPAELHVWCLS
ncbi:VIP36-like protein isoform X4 [Ailuropoda melanoleuca]|uniref:VIP36-like protein isoform X4 n=1 Tax=Ailuropoda melanoleuca TaxID=9646 RepID=UPI001494760C|nr:VIP36-like protein isoform X4 [Ailuropoda melanoleuca]